MSEMSPVSKKCICRLCRQAAEFIQEGKKRESGMELVSKAYFLYSLVTANEGTLDIHTPTNTFNWGKMQCPWGSNDFWFI